MNPRNEVDLLHILQSPLIQKGPGPFLRLVLAEAGRYGMPQQVIATLDDVAAMIGFYDPLPKGQAAHLGGPVVTWRTDPRQPTMERVHDVERLALKQRALIAFGGAPADHQVGTAEIVVALGNGHKANVPPEFFDVFTWASVDVLATLQQRSPQSVREEKKWPEIPDADVLKPGGRLHATYVTIATEIRRQVIASIKDSPDNPREQLLALAVFFLKSHELEQARAIKNGRADTAQEIQQVINNIRTMFPDIDKLADTLLDQPLMPAG